MAKVKKVKEIKPKHFRILSPDGFDIRIDKMYYTKKEIPKELDAFAKRYEKQGYYSSVSHGKIDISHIPEFCSVVPF